MQLEDVHAAGAVVVRDAGREVLLVHRPKYDDWSFPKGKLDPGELAAQAAVREVDEESGVQVRLGRPLPQQQYGLGNGRSKVVHYWVGHPAPGSDGSDRLPDREVDEVRWVDVDRAAGLLDYRRDRELLAAARAAATRVTTSVVMARPAAAKQFPEHLAALAHAHGAAPLEAAPGDTTGSGLLDAVLAAASAGRSSLVVAPRSVLRGVDSAVPDVPGAALETAVPEHLLEHGHGTGVRQLPAVPRLAGAARSAGLGAGLGADEALVLHLRDAGVVAVERVLLTR